ncbi:MAG: hypothetical protein IJH78_04425 [Clostridia bacterium]|nr:hypothetical protein [Clostridia bacterium]
MNGKQKCAFLKEIRRRIAQENDIDLIIEECTHKGDCRGTCPRCEAEVRYLERELEKRQQLKKRVALVGISAGMTLALTGCAAVDALVDRLDGVRADPTPGPAIDQPQGMVEPLTTGLPDEGSEVVLDGEVAPEEGLYGSD